MSSPNPLLKKHTHTQTAFPPLPLPPQSLFALCKFPKDEHHQKHLLLLIFFSISQRHREHGVGFIFNQQQTRLINIFWQFFMNLMAIFRNEKKIMDEKENQEAFF